ncbi:DNA repair protein RecO [Paraburkholderia caballeronis]|uniref:DNA repair protein RecO n=1 Tax=Paraburkholderia caballeronis TaxID=416943 RepID=A0A1H7MKA8_9BURK|nr:DNA repair protein RecO [Paraburkholderia caballeronis]PXW26536.1 DNA replication and repair protein RecO [Paraburkholderia caballeronis]PXX02083.1 DNA replication and repair protein RecO [Paraburkholderia caballeronis]RAK01240.1 DNA replication and repair protein RecO [Paraburkholderia caballeronis]SEB89871.1 DNA replication and repair protein RecO [Paraburkholderia caballeronis]SEL11693.1 DNA replication and repair protein RecO [Paraburkholderia caballeronis]
MVTSDETVTGTRDVTLDASDDVGAAFGGGEPAPDDAPLPAAAPRRARGKSRPSAGEASASEARTKSASRRAPRAPSVPDYRIAEQPAFVLHSYPYRETSLIIDVLSRDHGRVALVAKGAKRPHSALRGVLQTFQPLSLSWTGKGEVRTLTGAEWVGGMRPLAGDALLCGFYANELLVKFLAREDAHPQLFHHYVVTLTRLAYDEPPVQVLRSFERVLLRETGYALALDRTVARRAVVPEGRYVFDPERGVRDASDEFPAQWPVLSGQTLLDMEQDDYHRPQTVTQSKALMRFLLNTYLGGTPLATRQILIDLQNL